MPAVQTAPGRKLAPEHWVLLAVLGIGAFFEGYDSFVFTVALPQIRETFGLSQSTASFWLGVLFVGALPAVLLARYADVYGRKRLLLLSIAGYSLFTGLTAFSGSVPTFVGSQFLARLFLNAECAIAWTIVAEELPARTRGFGFGFVAMASAGGTALSSLLYGGVFAPMGITWRWLYIVGLAPLAVVCVMWGRLRETRRFTTARISGSLAEHWHQLLRAPHRRWFFLVGVTDLLFALSIVVDVFCVDFMQTDRGLSASAANMVFLVAGLAAMPVLTIAGSLSDRYGRKIVGCTFAALNAVGTVSFFVLGYSTPALFFSLSLVLIGQFGAWPTLDAYYTELFPTGLRAFASSSASLWRVPGEALGLLIGSALIAVTGVGPAAVMLTVGPIVAAVIVWKTFPETCGLELEAIQGRPAPVRHADWTGKLKTS